MEVIVTLLLELAVAATSLAAADPSAQASPLQQPQTQYAHILPDSLVCGPHSAYLMLRLYGIPVSYDSLRCYRVVHEDGMSLVELRDALTVLGLPADVRRCDAKQLRRGFDFPVVAYLKGKLGPYHHYVIVISIQKDAVTVLDSTTGEIVRMHPDRFDLYYDGFIVAPELRTTSPLIPAVCSIGVWLIVAAIACVAPPLRVRRRTPGSGRRCHIHAARADLKPQRMREAEPVGEK